MKNKNQEIQSELISQQLLSIKKQYPETYQLIDFSSKNFHELIYNNDFEFAKQFIDKVNWKLYLRNKKITTENQLIYLLDNKLVLPNKETFYILQDSSISFSESFISQHSQYLKYLLNINTQVSLDFIKNNINEENANYFKYQTNLTIDLYKKYQDQLLQSTYIWKNPDMYLDFNNLHNQYLNTIGETLLNNIDSLNKNDKYIWNFLYNRKLINKDELFNNKNNVPIETFYYIKEMPSNLIEQEIEKFKIQVTKFNKNFLISNKDKKEDSINLQKKVNTQNKIFIKQVDSLLNLKNITPFQKKELLEACQFLYVKKRNIGSYKIGNWKLYKLTEYYKNVYKKNEIEVLKIKQEIKQVKKMTNHMPKNDI